VIGDHRSDLRMVGHQALVGMGATVLPNSAGALSLRQKPVDFPDGAGRARLPPTLRKDRAPAAF
jgi:hypothetical protein